MAYLASEQGTAVSIMIIHAMHNNITTVEPLNKGHFGSGGGGLFGGCPLAVP